MAPGRGCHPGRRLAGLLPIPQQVGVMLHGLPGEQQVLFLETGKQQLLPRWHLLGRQRHHPLRRAHVVEAHADPAGVEQPTHRQRTEDGAERRPAQQHIDQQQRRPQHQQGQPGGRSQIPQPVRQLVADGQGTGATHADDPQQPAEPAQQARGPDPRQQ
ncbi:hypothetical protein D3C75_718250 [compost metagenome]